MKLPPRSVLKSASLFLVFCLCPQAHADTGAGPPAPGASEAGHVKGVDPLVSKVQRAIDISKRRHLQANVHTPWQVMHGVLALRSNYQVKLDNKQVSAIEWMSNGATFRGENWFEKTQFGGRAHPYSYAYAFEGHPNQFLAILSMANLPLHHKFKAGNNTITLADLIKHAKAEVNATEEVTWTLWALSHYLGAEAVWENKYGEPWSVERLARIQTNDRPEKAACGGTHGLFALTYARNRYLQTGKRLRGVWMEAHQKILRYTEAARQYQNEDGTFSANFFEGYQYSDQVETRLSSSGHTLEFLMLAIPNGRLKEEWVRNGIQAVADDLIEHRHTPIECGALYHALDGLVIYRDRMVPRPVQPKKVEDAPVEAPKPTDVQAAAG